MKTRLSIDELTLAGSTEKNPPGMMIYREFMLVLTYIDPETCGVILQALFELILHGETDKGADLSQRDTELLNRMLERYTQSVEDYREMCRKNAEKGKKSAESRARKQAKEQQSTAVNRSQPT